MIKIGICDDNETLLKRYQKMIQEICEKNKLEFTLTMFSDGADVAKAVEQNREALDILFLDILMEKMNGIEAARHIRLTKSKTRIIFLTSSEEYIFDSMDIKAFAYVMKEKISKEALEKILLNAYTDVMKQQKDVLVFEKEDGSFNLSYSDICFIKSYKGFCYLHHWDGIIFESVNQISLTNLDETFFKVHEQYIINLSFIKKIDKNNVTLNDESENVIPVEKSRIKELKLKFAQYMMEKM